MADLERRIKLLEQQIPTEPVVHLALFRLLYGTVPQGWQYADSDGKKICIMRQPHETDESLEKRAAAAARAARPGRPVVLYATEIV
jgi:hypothetical protein